MKKSKVVPPDGAPIKIEQSEFFKHNTRVYVDFLRQPVMLIPKIFGRLKSLRLE